MADNSDILEMSDDDLMAEWTALGAEVEDNQERLRAFSHEYQDRCRLEQLNLEPGDARLLQRAEAMGIESEEQVLTEGTQEGTEV